MIIGVTGRIGAGKGTIVQYLRKKGFVVFSFSKMIRQEALKRGYGMDRASLEKVGDLIREEKGDEAVFAKRIMEKINKQKVKNAAIDGIRQPWEIKEFRKHGNFYLIAVDADQRIRFERTAKRGKPSDQTDFEKFKYFDEKEYYGRGKAHQQIKKSMEMADFYIRNDGTLEELYKKVDDVLKKIRRNQKTKKRD
ncbi:MAG: AAA family ATPase [Candidatus Woesearchaeota archaeon]|nr:AAA family ATPase [Candidatus Woesearchaeota archaeon]